MLLAIIACIAAGYILGGFNGAILISNWFHREDVRQKGSGNAGLTNFFRSYGGVDSLLVIVIDAGKTVLACFIGGWILRGIDPDMTQTGQMLCGAAAVIGHVFPVLFRFHGGKGILPSAALAAFMDWRAFLICLVLFALTLAVSRYVSLGSILACVAYPFLFWWCFSHNWAVVVIAFSLAALAIYMHRSNIVRLINGTETKFSFQKRSQS